MTSKFRILGERDVSEWGLGHGAFVGVDIGGTAGGRGRWVGATLLTQLSLQIYAQRGAEGGGASEVGGLGGGSVQGHGSLVGRAQILGKVLLNQWLESEFWVEVSFAAC